MNAVAQTGPVAAYGFNEASGTVLNDRSGNGHTGVISGAAWAAGGRFGSALQFDGVNDLVTVSDTMDSLLDLTAGMTIEAWVKPSALAGWNTVLLKESATGLVYSLYANDGDARVAGFCRIDAIDQSVVGVAGLTLDVWTHLAVTYDPGAMRLYVNGELAATRELTGAMGTSDEPLRIGGNGVWGEFFTGLIDEVRIYNRALTQAELQADITTAVDAPFPVLGDTTPPAVSVTGPANGSTIAGAVTVGATASDNVGVAGVQFLLNGANLGAEDTVAPYEIGWNTTTTANGDHTLTAIARDTAGNRTTSTAITVRVANDTTSPTATITAPANGATVSGMVTVTASATDNVGVAGVQFRLNGTNLGPEDAVPPYEIAWDTKSAANGNHTLSAVARDTAGNQMTSVAITVTVSNDTTSPTVSITAPANGANVSGMVTVTASATDNIGVAGVQFLLNGTPLGAEDTLTRFEVSWNTATVSNGVHTLGAVARDGTGNRGIAAGVTVTVANATDPTSPSAIGQWAPPVDLPTVAVHMILTHTGQLLIWEDGGSATLWDPATGILTPVPNATNLFCAGHAPLADGRILVVGGTGPTGLGIPAVNLLNPATASWTQGPNMSFGRWYPTATALPDGRILVTSGAPECANCGNEIPEVYDPVANRWTQLTGARLAVPLYPHMFVLADGRVLQAGAEQAAVPLRVLDVATQTWTTVNPVAGEGAGPVMYEQGKWVKSGSHSGGDGPAVANTFVLDLNQSVASWRQTASMAFPRAFHNLTVLPDGSVLVTGGERRKDGIDPLQAVFAAELWSPATETWRTLAPMRVPRLYHSTAVLLPDGRVVVAGSGAASGGVDQRNAEIFSPPYLFKGPRPVIETAPTTIQYGSQFVVQTADAADIASVALIRPGSVTHAFDQNQRFINLAFTRVPGGLAVQAPTSANSAPPGYYMLFLVNSNGVPSVAPFVQLPLSAEDRVPPTAPLALTANGGITTATLTWVPSTDNISVTLYNVHRSTRPGFAPTLLNRVSRVTGTSYTDTGLSGGIYVYLVTAEDAAGNVGPPSNEAGAAVQADITPPIVSITAPADGTTVSGTITVSASANDESGVAGVQFRVDGANLGAEDTAPPFAIAWNTAAATDRTHVLTAVARDAAGNSAESTGVGVTVSNSAPAQAGLVAAYGFNEGTGTSVADASGNGNAGTVSGATWTAGHSGAALVFDGVNDWVTVNNSPSLALSGPLTLEAWVFPSDPGGWQTVVLKETPAGLAYALYSSDAGALPAGYVNIGDDAAATGVATATANSWTHLAATYDGAALSLYMNGSLVRNTLVAGSVTTSGHALRIGGNALWGEFFNGRIDDVRIYGRALTQAEIQQDMATPVP